jgi:hypothetical protein
LAKWHEDKIREPTTPLTNKGQDNPADKGLSTSGAWARKGSPRKKKNPDIPDAKEEMSQGKYMFINNEEGVLPHANIQEARALWQRTQNQGTNPQKWLQKSVDFVPPPQDIQLKVTPGA